MKCRPLGLHALACIALKTFNFDNNFDTQANVVTDLSKTVLDFGRDEVGFSLWQAIRPSLRLIAEL